MKKSKIYYNVYKEGKNFYTKSLVKGQSVYGEQVKKGVYRKWVPDRSKLGAALRKRIKNFMFTKNSNILYLGCASGTTCSHLSDVCETGRVYGIDHSYRVFTKFLELCKTRKNIYPIFADARYPEQYHFIKYADIVFQDIAQRDQLNIFIKNCEKYLKNKGYGYLVIKARSIDVSEKPKNIFKQVRKELKKKYSLIEEKNLKPYEKDHKIFVIQNS